MEYQRTNGLNAHSYHRSFSKLKQTNRRFKKLAAIFAVLFIIVLVILVRGLLGVNA